MIHLQENGGSGRSILESGFDVLGERAMKRGRRLDETAAAGTRRELLLAAVAAGTALPFLGASEQDASASGITADTIASAEKLHALAYTRAEREQNRGRNRGAGLFRRSYPRRSQGTEPHARASLRSAASRTSLRAPIGSCAAPEAGLSRPCRRIRRRSRTRRSSIKDTGCGAGSSRAGALTESIWSASPGSRRRSSASSR